MASADATALWAAVVGSYPEPSLKQLTNLQNAAATGINTANGEDAAETLINLWPAYAQVDYDSANAMHVDAGKLGVIAILWRRGGTSTNVQVVKWEEVFGQDGVLMKVKRTDPRGRQNPTSNSGVRQSTELSNGQRVQGWSDAGALPLGHSYLPARRLAD